MLEGCSGLILNWASIKRRHACGHPSTSRPRADTAAWLERTCKHGPCVDLPMIHLYYPMHWPAANLDDVPQWRCYIKSYRRGGLGQEIKTPTKGMGERREFLAGSRGSQNPTNFKRLQGNSPINRRCALILFSNETTFKTYTSISAF